MSVKKRRLLICSGFLGAGLLVLLSLADKPPVANARQRVEAPSGAKGLTAENLADRENAAKLILSRQKVLVGDLIKLASRKVEPIRKEGKTYIYPYKDAKHLSIMLLGDLRAVEAIGVLLENIEYRNPRSIVASYMDLGGWHPAAGSLSKIGMPAIGPVLGRLAKYDKDCKGRQLCAWVIKKTLGEKLAKLRLEIAIEQAKRDMLRMKEKNLRAAIPYFKTSKERAAQERAKQKEKDSDGTKE